jgi:nucleoside-diphosphate-sugar epimerase
MRILITGGAGFIGSHLAEAHLEKGAEVYVIDDLSTGSTSSLYSTMRIMALVSFLASIRF